MADRLLKSGLLASARIGGVSEFAELLFVRLLLCACPLGRFYADPAAVKKAALPNRPRKRTSDVASALDELDRAGLIARYNAPPGEALLFIPRFGQRYKFPVRSPFPAPPGDPPGQQSAPVAKAAAPDPPRREGEEEEVSVARARPALVARAHSHDSVEVWKTRLLAEYPGIDIDSELIRAERYVVQKRGPNAKLTRVFFEENWLPGCMDTVDVRRVTGKASLTKDLEPEPTGWLPALLELFPACAWTRGGHNEGNPWRTVPPEIQKQVREHLAGKTTASSTKFAEKASA